MIETDATPTFSEIFDVNNGIRASECDIALGQYCISCFSTFFEPYFILAVILNIQFFGYTIQQHMHIRVIALSEYIESAVTSLM